MENDKKIIGMDFKVVQGLNWIIFVFGIVALAVDHAKMTKQQKQQIIQVFVFDVFTGIISIILSIIGAIVGGIAGAKLVMDIISYVYMAAVFVIFLIFMINAFMGKFLEMPICYNIAGSFLKDQNDSRDNNNNEAKNEAVDIEENKEEKVDIEEK